MKYIEGQLMGVMAQVLYRHAEIVSGAYKLRDGDRGLGKDAEGRIMWAPLTDEEKLKSSMGIMQAQIHRLQDTIEAMGAASGPACENPWHRYNRPGVMCPDCGDGAPVEEPV